MSHLPHGELTPEGGGDAIPLQRTPLTLGRRESCDICMRFPNVSGLHCELFFRNGYWYVKDLNSTNGVKVNGSRVQEKLLHPDDKLTVGKRHYVIHYELPAGQRAKEEVEENIMSQSLMERAGLERRKARRSASQGAAFDPADFLLEEDE